LSECPRAEAMILPFRQSQTLIVACWSMPTDTKRCTNKCKTLTKSFSTHNVPCKIVHTHTHPSPPLPYTNTQQNSPSSINDIRKNRGDNPIQDSPLKESAICLFDENTTPNIDSTETELTLLKFRLDQNQSCPHTRSRSQSRRTLVVSRHCFSSSDRR
jgi:hypothetical protein